ncbi:hypothetical protein ACJZ2D_004535 [Fusarium nematophilum]
MPPTELNRNVEKAAGNERDTDIKIVYGLRPRSRDYGTHAELLQTLYSSAYFTMKNSNPQRVDGTCEWFTSHPQFRRWRDDGVTGLLWVTGDPGCGKSVLSRYLADEVLRNLSSCYFFFKAEVNKQNTAEGALRCVLRQLFEQRPQLLSHQIFQQFEDDGDKLQQPIRRLWRILISAAALNKASPIVCILDGLDECKSGGRQILCKILYDFFRQGHMDARLKVLITSRTLPHSERRWYELGTTFPFIHLDRYTQSDFNSLAGEICLAADHRLAALCGKLKLTGAEAQAVRTEVVKVPKQTHLWVFLVFDYLHRCAAQSPDKLKEVARNLPVTVDEAYEKILSTSSNPAKAKKLLHIIVAASRPLTLSEMAVALAVEESHTSQSELDFEPDEHLRNIFRELCGPLVSVVDNRIYLFHHTVREFLVQEQPVSASSRTTLASQGSEHFQWKSSICPGASNRILGQICAQYLLFTDVADNFQNPPKNAEVLRVRPLDCLSENYPFLGYAWENWPVHLRQGRCEDDASVHRMIQLCSPHTLSTLIWIRRKWCQPTLDTTDLTPLIVASYLGLPAMVIHLLSSTTNDPNARDGMFGRPAVSWAASEGFESVVKPFIDFQRASRRRSFVKRLFGTSSIDLDLKSKPHRPLRERDRPSTPLGWAVRLGHEEIVKRLLGTGRVKVDERMLFDAARVGSPGVVRALLETRQVKIDSRDLFKRTLLSWAAQYGHEGLTKYLLAKGGFEIDARDAAGRTPLTYAARSGEDQVLGILLATGKFDADVNDNLSRTPLSCAAEQGHETCVRLLLATGKTNVNARDERGETPLSHAASQGQQECVRMLLVVGKADVNTEDYMGRTPLDLASMRGFEGCIKMLEQAQLALIE